MLLSRDVPLVPAEAALLIVDVQNLTAHRGSPSFSALSPEAFAREHGWFFEQLEAHVLGNIQLLQSGCRKAGVEVIYTTIESLTKDGRDRSLDYKISGFNVPKGSWEGQVVDQIAPGPDEIVLPKTSSSVFISTNIDYVLRNLGVKQLAVVGFLTDQCISSTIRDACDLGYLVTQVTDACATKTPERHETSIAQVAGYCRQITTREVLSELAPGQQLG